MDAREGNGEHARSRIMTQCNGTLLKDYHPDQGVPPWLPGDLHAEWQDQLDKGAWPEKTHYASILRKLETVAQREDCRRRCGGTPAGLHRGPTQDQPGKHPGGLRPLTRPPCAPGHGYTGSTTNAVRCR